MIFRFYCVHLKRYIKGSVYIMFKKIVRAVFLNTCTLETENWVQNLDIHQFSYSDRLVHSKRDLNEIYLLSLK